MALNFIFSNGDVEYDVVFPYADVVEQNSDVDLKIQRGGEVKWCGVPHLQIFEWFLNEKGAHKDVT